MTKRDWTGILYPNCYNNKLVKELTAEEIKKARNNYDRYSIFSIKSLRPIAKYVSEETYQTFYLTSLSPSIKAKGLIINEDGRGYVEISFSLAAKEKFKRIPLIKEETIRIGNI